MESLRGQFLVASPHLPDGNFFRSVVLMLEHSDEGAFGLVLNRPTNTRIGELWKALDEEEPLDADDPIYQGGPVPGPLLAIHGDREIGEGEALPKLFVTARPEHVRQLLEQRRHPFRLFNGYSGWGAGQLDGEMTMGGWLTTPATAEDVFSDHNTLWDRLTRRINLDILRPAVPSKQVPDDAWLN